MVRDRKRHPRAGRLAFHGCLLALLSAISTGCPPVTSTTDGTSVATDGNTGLDPKQFPNQRIAGEPNNSFDTALTIILDSQGIGKLEGTISPADDVDVYSLGQMLAGDRVIVDVGTDNDGLDADIAIFDGGGRLVAENDDRNYDLQQLDPFLNHVIRQDSLIYYVAIASSPANPTTGAYHINLTVTRDGTVPAPSGQIVALDFDGGSIQINGQVQAVGPFDTANISASYAGMTGQVRNQIRATVLQNYDGLNLDVRTVPGDPVPGGCTVSTILFGGRSSSSFGISQDVDPYNQNHCDGAIIHTEAFTPAIFGRVLTAQELGTAIGNVASHELGHLLGLNHTADVNDLMDTTGAATTLLRDQEFLDAPLDSSIFPIGTQDSLLLLVETLGTAP